MPLLERVRVEIYIPDIASLQYENLLRSLQEEFTYAFGGSTVLRALEGSYLSLSGERMLDRINVLYTDAPLALSTDYSSVAVYGSELMRAVSEVLSEEAVLVSIEQVFHVQ